MILATAGSPHPYTIVKDTAGRVAPACGCGWRGQHVNPATLGTPDTIRQHLRGPLHPAPQRTGGKRMSTAYLSGPMTGYPGYNYAAFAHAGGLLLDAGYTVLDPSRHGFVEGWTWADYMREALRDIAGAEGVVVLPGWECSRGAILEVHIAQQLGMPVLPLDIALANPPRQAAA